MIYVYPKHIIEKAIREKYDFKDIPVISISNNGEKITGVDNLNIIQLEFRDDGESFTLEQARKIKEFVDAKKDSPVFFVHCDAGISRSGAVGLWVTKYLGMDEKEFYEKNKRIHPSSYVLSMLNKVSNTNYRIRSLFEFEMTEKGW
jgi:predicted protein tyrosine phosphatase